MCVIKYHQDQGLFMHVGLYCTVSLHKQTVLQGWLLHAAAAPVAAAATATQQNKQSAVGSQPEQHCSPFYAPPRIVQRHTVNKPNRLQRICYLCLVLLSLMLSGSMPSKAVIRK